MTGEETDPTAGDTELLTAGEFIPWELEPPSAPWFFLTERAADPGIRFHIQRGGLRATPDLPLDEPWARDLSSSLGELARLPVGWDTYGSPPPPLDLVWQVLRLLVFVERTDLPLPAVVPLPGGGIQLEWETASRELEVGLSGTIAENDRGAKCECGCRHQRVSRTRATALRVGPGMGAGDRT